MNILGKILEAVLKPKFQKEANKLVKSEEYQKIIKDMAHSTNELNKITQKLKKATNDKQAVIDSAKASGIDLKPYKTIDELMSQFPGHQSLHDRYNKKS